MRRWYDIISKFSSEFNFLKPLSVIVMLALASHIDDYFYAEVLLKSLTIWLVKY
jgi:hypothetical protein